MPRLQLFLVVPALALASVGCVINVDADHVVVREEKQFAVGPGADVALETFDGSVKVESWAQSTVRVEIEKRGPDQETAAALEVRATQEGDRIRVEAPAPKVRREFIGIGNYSGPSVSFVVRLPEKVKLTVRTGDGSIAVNNVSGTVELRSGDGSIRAAGVDGDVTAHTEDGSLSLVDVSGRLNLESGDGSVRVDGRVDGLRARTGDGSIVIEAEAGSAMRDDWDVSTGDGSIVLRVPDGFDADIDAESRDGRVRSTLEGLESTRHESGRGSLRGRLGSGGHKVTLRSGDGSITVASR